MQPQEVAGLQALAQSQGTSLTINPATGMPEAFNLGGFFKSLLPTIIGIGTGGAGLPLWAGIAAGAGVGALTNDDPLMGAVMGGLGGYGGQGIGSSLFNAGATAAPAAATTAQAGASTGTQLGQNIGTQLTNAGANMSDPLVQDLIKQQVNSSVATIPQQGMFNAGTVNQATMATNLPFQNAQLGSTQFIPGSGPNMGQINPVTPTPGLTVNTSGGYKPFGDISMENLSQTGRGFSGVMSGDEAALEAFRKGMGAESNLGALGKSMLPVGGAALGGIEPSDLGYGGPSIDDIRKKTKYRGPSGQLNLDANYNQDTGEYEGLPSLQLATGGSVNTNQSTISSGGLQDLYGSNDNTGTAPLSQDGYGIGRLDKLAQQGSLSKAGDMFYAQGGPVSFADGGDSNKEDAMGLPSLSPDMPMYTNAGTDNLAIVQSAMQGMQGNAPMTQGQMPDQNNDSLIAKVTANLMADPNYQPENPIEEAIIKQLKGTDPMQQGQPSLQGLQSLAPSQPMAPSYNPSQAMAPSYNPSVASTASYGGDTNTPFMAKGGYLDGPGDGLSDSIPATIEGKQPARLADGEFVVSADVVSALGNGSSKAGAKHLYAMMDRIRQNAHGTKKQIRKVNTKQVMPA
jgi:hypothetical protein